MRSISPELVLVDPELAALARELLPDAPDCLAPRSVPVRDWVVVTPGAAVVPAAANAVVDPAPAPVVRAAAPAPDLRAPAGSPIARTRVEKPIRLPERRVRRRRIAVASAATWLVGTLVVASPLLAFLPPPASERPRLAAVPVQRPPAPSHETTSRALPTLLRAPKPIARAKAVAPGPHRTRKASSPRATRAIAVRWPADERAAFYNLILVGDGDRLDLWPEKNVATLVSAASRRAAKASVTYAWFAYPGYRTRKGVHYGPLVAHGTVRLPEGSVKSQQRSVTRPAR